MLLRPTNDWWLTQAKNAIHKMMIQVLPVIICWELWKTRCACKYGNQTRFYTRKMEQQVLWHIRAAMRKAYPNLKLDYPWVELCDIVERIRQKTNSRVILWTHPSSYRLYLGDPLTLDLGPVLSRSFDH